jgi:hypothetical protein
LDIEHLSQLLVHLYAFELPGVLRGDVVAQRGQRHRFGVDGVRSA